MVFLYLYRLLVLEKLLLLGSWVTDSQHRGHRVKIVLVVFGVYVALNDNV